MIKAGDEVVALVTYRGRFSGKSIIKGEIYTVESTRIVDYGALGINLSGQEGYWSVEYEGTTYFRKVTRPRVSASSELTKKLTEEVREGEKRKEIEYEPATANK